MPTIQVSPEDLDLLQHVADTLFKSRKMVIVTGAGISTNSGIPDFRSENGLYSLIQSQFECAEANASAESRKDIPEDRAITASTAPATDSASSFDISTRPLKRRRVSEPRKNTPLVRKSSSRLRQSASHLRTNPPEAPPTATVPVPSPGGSDTPQHADQDVVHEIAQDAVADVTSFEIPQMVTRSKATTLRSALSRQLTRRSTGLSATNDAISANQPTSSGSSQTDSSISTDTAEHSGSSSRSSTPRRSARAAYIACSSPLSSPPPDLFDPYDKALTSDTSSNHDSDCYDMSASDDTQQSLDILSSQASSSNLRNMKGRDLFDSNIWSDPLKTSVFYRFATSLRQRVKVVEPTVTHLFIAQMRDVGKLARVYTQNIDEIEKKIGLSTDLKHGCGAKKRKSMKLQAQESIEKEEANETIDDATGSGAAEASQPVPKMEDPEASTQPKPRPRVIADKGVECVFLHGSLHSLRCFVCGKLCDWDEDGRESRTLSGEQPECPHCAGATAARQERGKRALGVGKLRPDIVLYGEEHPHSDLISPIVQHDLAAGPDLLLVLGTSLRVHGLKVMVKQFAKAVHQKGGKVIFINFTKPSESAWGDVLDYWIEWDCDAWVEDLKTRKPVLWLSPDERLELDRQRRETLAEKKREAVRKRESIAEKKRESLEDKKDSSTKQSTTTPPGPIKPKPTPKYPVAMRNDYQCGAYVVWDIFHALAKIGDRPFDRLGHVPSVPPPVSDPPAPALASSASPKTEHHSEPVLDHPAQPKVQKKRQRKSLPERPSVQRQRAAGKQIPCVSQTPIPPPSYAHLYGSILSTVPGLSSFTEPTITPTPTPPSKPSPKKRKPRKSAPATLIACAPKHEQVNPSNEVKQPDRQTGKQRFVDAAKELGKFRRGPSPGFLGMVNKPPVTPARPPLSFAPLDPGQGPTTHTNYTQVGADDNGSNRYPYSQFSFQPRPVLPPLPDLPSRHPATTHHHQLPALAPLRGPLDQKSPQIPIKAIEMTPSIGPVSPLAMKPPASLYHYVPHQPQHTHTPPQNTQPMYSFHFDAVPGLSLVQTPMANHCFQHESQSQSHSQSQNTDVDASQGQSMFKCDQSNTSNARTDSNLNDDKTPSPSEQLRKEAEADIQLRQVQVQV
ncbi:DHS-like NAD/FAD-binding domain-containing protein [Astrocystis sublimbata]|nr:DHS-like NAD/FAD-binding domain-containing protein [Astrocystis sublimbata]